MDQMVCTYVRLYVRTPRQALSPKKKIRENPFMLELPVPSLASTVALLHNDFFRLHKEHCG